MRKKRIWERVTAVALSMVMATGLLSAMGVPMTVEASGGSIASNVTFATKDDLIDNYYNLGDVNPKAMKVAFGKGGADGEVAQTWYIAGYDSRANNLVLICDPNMPLTTYGGTCVPFSYQYSSPTFAVTDTKGLSISTCQYVGETPTEVGMNHYGLSRLRAELKKIETEKDIFTSSEQDLMLETTIYTYDKKNECYYSTTDKLYAAHAYYVRGYYTPYMVVGKNSPLFPNRGLKICLEENGNPDYNTYSYGNSFWLRTPVYDGNKNLAYKSNYGSWGYTESIANTSYNVIPAFAFDISSVLLASAIPVAGEAWALPYDREYYDRDPLIFRIDDTNYGHINSNVEFVDVVTSEAVYDVSGNEIQPAVTYPAIKVTKAKDSASLWLCVQGKDNNGKDWYSRVKVDSTRDYAYTYFYSSGADDLSECAVWIETTVDNVTYAKMAENIAAPKASLKDGTYTSNQTVSLSTKTEGATIYYTTDGTTPNLSSKVYTSPISITGAQGEEVAVTIKAMAVSESGEESSVSTFKYTIALPHVHNWGTSWNKDKTAHWLECSEANCTVVSDKEKSGYGTHTMDAGTVTKQPTPKSNGRKVYKCSVCGYEMKQEILPATTADSEKDAGSGTGGNTSNESGKESAKPAAKNTTLTVATAGCSVKVTSSSESNPTVAYTKPTNNKATTVTIPATVTVNGVTYKVTSISTNAFANNKTITKVIIGKNVNSIGKNAFKNCTKLKTVTIGSNVTTIGTTAFYKCTALTKIIIPAKVSKIGKQAFYGCKKLKTITIKTKKLTTKKVGSKAFKGIYAKATIKVPSSKLSSYKKILKARGVSSKAKIKK